MIDTDGKQQPARHDGHIIRDKTMLYTGETQVLYDMDGAEDWSGTPTHPLMTEPTIRLGAILASAAEASLPRDSRALLVALLIIVAGAFKLGWHAAVLFAALDPYRGWAALLVFSIVAPIFLIWQSNKRGER